MKNPQALCYNKFRLRTEDFFLSCGRGKYEICVGKQVNFIWKKRKKHEITDESHHFFFHHHTGSDCDVRLNVLLFVGYKTKSIGEKYGLANATYRTISNNTLLLNAMTAEEYDEVEKTAKSDTSRLEETDYLAILNARLKKKQSFIAVCENGTIIYNGSAELSSEELENELPKYGDPGANSQGGVYFRNEKQWMVKQVDYENVDGKDAVRLS